jgi:hypothetical protein
MCLIILALALLEKTLLLMNSFTATTIQQLTNKAWQHHTSYPLAIKFKMMMRLLRLVCDQRLLMKSLAILQMAGDVGCATLPQYRPVTTEASRATRARVLAKCLFTFS